MDSVYSILSILLGVVVVLVLAYVPYMKFRNFCNTKIKNKYVIYLLQGCFCLFVLYILRSLIYLIEL